MEQTVDYKEYCRRIDLLRSCVKDIICNEKFDVLMVESCYQDDELTLGIGTFCECFNNPKAMFRYMRDRNMSFVGDMFKDEEDIRSRSWWSIKGYVAKSKNAKDIAFRKKYKDGLRQVISVDIDIEGNVLYVWNCEYLDDLKYWENNELLAKEVEWKSDWWQYFLAPCSVKLPFKPGDIILCDSRPFGYPFYCIYTGYKKTEEKQNQIDQKNKAEWAYKNGDFEQRDYMHTAIRYSADSKRLVEDQLGNCDCCYDVLFDKMTVVDRDKLQRGIYIPWET